jgi:hypothetical protein
MDIDKLYTEYKEKLETKESVSGILKHLEDEITLLQEKIIYWMQVNNITEFKIDNETIKLSIDAFPNVLVADHDKLKDFLGDQVAEVFSEKPSKLRSFVNKMINNDEPIPEFINLFMKESIKIKKEKKK